MILKQIGTTVVGAAGVGAVVGAEGGGTDNISTITNSARISPSINVSVMVPHLLDTGRVDDVAPPCPAVRNGASQ